MKKLILIIGVIGVIGGLLYAAKGPLCNSFNAGETAPLVKYRLDLEPYGSACQTLENLVVFPQGTAVRRPGTAMVSESADGANTRLIRFARATRDAYVIELGEHTARFYRNGGQIQE
jgi:hypothetical protein